MQQQPGRILHCIEWVWTKFIIFFSVIIQKIYRHFIPNQVLPKFGLKGHKICVKIGKVIIKNKPVLSILIDLRNHNGPKCENHNIIFLKKTSQRFNRSRATICHLSPPWNYLNSIIMILQRNAYAQKLCVFWWLLFY